MTLINEVTSLSKERKKENKRENHDEKTINGNPQKMRLAFNRDVLFLKYEVAKSSFKVTLEVMSFIKLVEFDIPFLFCSIFYCGRV